MMCRMLMKTIIVGAIDPALYSVTAARAPLQLQLRYWRASLRAAQRTQARNETGPQIRSGENVV